MMAADWTKGFKFESKDQEEGFLALFQYLRNGKPLGCTGPAPEVNLDERTMQICAFFIQKDHESNEWWDERVSELAKLIENQVLTLTQENQSLRSDVDELKSEIGKLLGRSP